MDCQNLIQQLHTMKQFFDRSTSVLTEADSNYAPAPGMFTVAQQVAHTAQCVDWFIEGAFVTNGFRMDFEGMEKEVRAVNSLTEARAWFDRAIANSSKILGGLRPDQLEVPLPPQGIMDGHPRWHVVPALSDHTAHHRGALTVYTRLLGRTPPMPYM